jgi:hypothetical protein
LFVVNSLFSIIFIFLAVIFVSFDWRLSLIWITLAILFNPLIKSFLIQKFKFNPIKILLPKLFILLIGVIVSLIIIDSKNQAKFVTEKQNFLKDRTLHVNELKELLTQEKYEDVIAKGEPNIKFDQEVQEIVENAKKLQNTRERKAQIGQVIQQVKQLMIEKKYQEANNLARSFQDSPELQALAEKALKNYIKELLSLAKTIPESDLSSYIDIYRRLVELVPKNKEYKTKLSFYEDKQHQEQQKEEKIAQLKNKIKQQFSSWDGSHRKVVEAVKKAMNDPKSFEHIETSYVVSENEYVIVKMVFRGKNAFGALVKNTVYAKVDPEGNILTLEKGE